MKAQWIRLFHLTALASTLSSSRTQTDNDLTHDLENMNLGQEVEETSLLPSQQTVQKNMLLPFLTATPDNHHSWNSNS